MKICGQHECILCNLKSARLIRGHRERQNSRTAILKDGSDIWKASFQKSDGEHLFHVKSRVLLPLQAIPSSAIQSVHKVCFLKQLLLTRIFQEHLNDLTLGTIGDVLAQHRQYLERRSSGSWCSRQMKFSYTYHELQYSLCF